MALDRPLARFEPGELPSECGQRQTKTNKKYELNKNNTTKTKFKSYREGTCTTLIYYELTISKEIEGQVYRAVCVRVQEM
jgi:hypothetical protein